MSITIRLTLLLLIVSNTQVRSQDGNFFNYGRTRCFGGGFSISADGKTMYHVEMFKNDSLQPPRLKIAESKWKNGSWGAPLDLGLTPLGSEVAPVLSPDEKRLYFAATSPRPGKDQAGDLNVWYIEKTPAGWSAPVFAEGLNSEMTDRFTSVDRSGNFYFISNKDGNQDVYTTHFTDGKWSTPQPVATWNSPLEEEHVSVNDALGIAFLQRTEPRVRSEIYYSVRTSGQWSEPIPFDYKDKSTQLPYIQRAPMLSPDGGTFYLVAQGLIWEQGSASLLKRNGISIKAPRHSPLMVSALSAKEPEVFGGLKLKTNNGISFSPDMKTIYVSRYTQERDSTGNQFIKIFESSFANGSWSDYKLLPFCKAQVPFEYHPVLSGDSRRMFFNSRAPLPGSSKKYLPKNTPWYADRSATGAWLAPVAILSLSTDDHDDYVSVARSGNLYFRSDRPGGLGGGDIYFSRCTEGRYEAPRHLAVLSSKENENDVCIDPGERFIIFNRYYDATKEIRLFISMRNGESWTAPRLLTQLERANNWELTPSLSPDGKYFFYEVNSNILRVETSTLFSFEELRMLKG